MRSSQHCFFHLHSPRRLTSNLFLLPPHSQPGYRSCDSKHSLSDSVLPAMSRPFLARGALRLTVVSIENLRISPQLVSVRLAIGRQMHQSEPVYSSSRTVNTAFDFTLSGSERNEEHHLSIEVRDGQAGSNSREVGSAVVPLSEVVGWNGVQPVDIVASNGVQICGTVVLHADFTADNSPAQPPLYPALSPQPAYNPAFYGGSPSSAEPPPPYQRIDPYAPQQQPPQQYSSGAGYSPHPYPPPLYSPQAQAVPSQPAAFYPGAAPSPTWAAQSPPPPPPAPAVPMPVAAPVVQSTTFVLPQYGTDVKDPRHQHPLRHMPTMYNGTGYACNLCAREYNGNGFHCSVCNFDLCPTCFVQRQQQSAQGVAPVRDVRHQHPLHWQRLTGAGYRNGFRCDGCGAAGRSEAWHCQQCSYDLHAQCLRQVR